MYADLNNDNMTTLTLETVDEKVVVTIENPAIDVVEFMELVELLLVNAKYEQRDIEEYITAWAKDIKSSKEN